MRRAQLDRGSQAVRNLVLNPVMDTALGTTAVRTNLAKYPGFDAVGTTINVRQNLCINPRGVNAFSFYSGAGSQTITANVAITGHPEGITTANRVSYSGTPSNPGVQFFNGVIGTNYTFSAWVYIESLAPTPGTIGWAESGVLSGPVYANTVGTWQKVTWNRTPTSTNGFGIRVASPDGGSGSFLITGIVIEAAPIGYASTTFFDGATAAGGDFTYQWAGTANASISNQRCSENAGWSPITNSVEYQSVTAPVHGTKCGAVLTKGANGDGITASDSVVTAFQTYTMSVYIKLTTSLPSFTMQMRWKDSVGTIIYDDNAAVYSSLIIGSWVRVSMTATSPANATSMQPIFRCQAVHTPTLFYIDSLLIETGSFLTAYFDGSTAAAGDFTYAWTGTAFQTTSEERAPTVSGWTGLYSNRVAWQSSAWSASGSKSLAVAGGRPTVDSFAMLSTSGLGTVGGKTYTFLANLKTLEAYPVGADTRAWSLNIAVNLAGGGQFQYNLKPATTFAGVHELRSTLTIRSDATTVAYMRLYNGSPNDVPVYWDNFMIVEGSYSGDFIDGTKALSKWDGTAHASTSIGYPPQFFDIAGKPTVDLLNGQTLGSNVVPAFDARTIYVVYESTGNASNYSSYASYGVTGSKGYMCQTGPTGSFTMAHRFDFPGGTFNGAMAFTSSRTSKRFVVAMTFNQGMTSVSGCTNGGADLTTVLTPGTGWDDGRAAVGNVSDGKGIRMLVFYAEHDRATRLAISRYLGNKYGAPVA